MTFWTTMGLKTMIQTDHGPKHLSVKQKTRSCLLGTSSVKEMFVMWLFIFFLIVLNIFSFNFDITISSFSFIFSLNHPVYPYLLSFITSFLNELLYAYIYIYISKYNLYTNCFPNTTWSALKTYIQVPVYKLSLRFFSPKSCRDRLTLSWLLCESCRFF